MRPAPQRVTARYHVDVAVVGNGAAACLAAALLQARGVRVALVGDPVRALSYELAGFGLPKRAWYRTVGGDSPLHELYAELGLNLGAHTVSTPESDRFVAPHGEWPWDVASYTHTLEHGWNDAEDESPYRVFYSKLDKHLSRGAGGPQGSALARDPSLRQPGTGTRDVDMRLVANEMVRRVAAVASHHLPAQTLPAVARDGKGPFLLSDTRTGAGLLADTLVWEGDARAFRSLSKDEMAQSGVRTSCSRFSMAVVTRGTRPTRSRVWLVLPDGGPMVEAVCMPGDGDATVWLLSADAQAPDSSSRRRALQGLQDYLLASHEHVLLADSVFDGGPVQLLDGEVLRHVPRADLRARGLSVEPESPELKYLIAPYASPPHQAHPSALRDVAVHFVGTALYPDWGFEGEIRSVFDVVNKLAPKRRKGLLR